MRIAVGIIRKSHGVRGEASVESLTKSLDRFSELTIVTLVSPDEMQTREATIEGARAHGDRALVKFRGIDTPEAIQPLHNWTIEIPRESARNLDDGEFFLHDLVGLRLVDDQGRERGVVKDVYENGGRVLLEVEGPNGDYDVPFASDICKAIVLSEGKIVVDLPEGLDDLAHVAD
jgi:16S rRNA processing protein RimM